MSEQSTIERRYVTHGVEARAAENKRPGMMGYAAKFGVVYDMGWYTEELSKDAFKEADLSDVRILLNHDPNLILGRTAAGTARVGVDDIGLFYEVDELPNSPNGENVRVALERGEITQSSWGFMLDHREGDRGDMWAFDSDKPHRILKRAGLVFDASPVTFPANPDTTAAKRSADIAHGVQRTEQQADKLDEAEQSAKAAQEEQEQSAEQQQESEQTDEQKEIQARVVNLSRLRTLSLKIQKLNV